jgi:hypothetical protein
MSRIFILTAYDNYNDIVKEIIEEHYNNTTVETFSDPYKLEDRLEELKKTKEKPALLISEIDSFRNERLLREFHRPLDRVLNKFATSKKLCLLAPGDIMDATKDIFKDIKGLISEFIISKIKNFKNTPKPTIKEIKNKLYLEKIKSIKNLLESHSHDAKERIMLENLKKSYAKYKDTNSKDAMSTQIKILEYERKFIMDFLRKHDFYVNNRVGNTHYKRLFDRGLTIEKEIKSLTEKLNKSRLKIKKSPLIKNNIIKAHRK